MGPDAHAAVARYTARPALGASCAPALVVLMHSIQADANLRRRSHMGMALACCAIALSGKSGSGHSWSPFHNFDKSWPIR
jgi:hypothetical protein